MEDQTIAWVRGMSPAQLCVTPGSVCLLFDNVSNINYSNIPFQFSYNCVFLFKGTRVTFDWTSGHNMVEEVEKKLF